MIVSQQRLQQKPLAYFKIFALAWGRTPQPGFGPQAIESPMTSSLECSVAIGLATPFFRRRALTGWTVLAHAESGSWIRWMERGSLEREDAWTSQFTLRWLSTDNQQAEPSRYRPRTSSSAQMATRRNAKAFAPEQGGHFE
jgi:hypothetical protein